MKLHPDLWRNNKGFIVILIILQAAILVFYRFFYQVSRHNADDYNSWIYPMYQDVNVMMLIGFGFLMTFVKYGSWSALGFTFLINAIIVQYYLVWSTFWQKVMHGTWDSITVYVR